ncbi:scopoletin glucosyltransferase-like [Iris pallida]|uniref:Glycosyltransferase n=1 Tax=Iris pallida TaxID=29817 RepID=A0AAX6FUW1_IRIPA|nr:scopoletin glucosyltransferase-like [Iris pallida]
MAASEGSSMATPKPLNVFFIPWFATGHLIPMVDVARLFASRGVDSTVLVTPANAALVRRTVDGSSLSGHPIRTLLYPFPSAEAGLHPGVENLASLPSKDTYKIDAATPYARPALENLLRVHRPDAVVADVHFGWTALVARDLGIPKLIFHALGLFPVCAMGSISKFKPHLDVRDDTETFLIPGLPHSIRVARPELPEFFLRDVKELSTFVQEKREAEASAMGVIVNSFSGIENAYADHLYKTSRLRSWFVGPVSLAANSSKQEQAVRGGNEDSDARPIAAWLDTKPAGSVVYVCFGSWCHFSDEQTREMASGLENCGHPYLWIVREDSDLDTEPSEKGMVVKGWAPQVAILGHPAVGAFVTHCGWNSLLEGLSAGLPMVTWPLSTEQFINEKLVVDVLRVGVKNWDGFRTTVEEDKVTVKAEDIAAAVGKVMGGAGEEAERMMRRAKEYGGTARAAVDVGGSSYNGLSSLIDEIRSYKK